MSDLIPPPPNLWGPPPSVSPLISVIMTGPKRGVNPLNEIKTFKSKKGVISKKNSGKFL